MNCDRIPKYYILINEFESRYDFSAFFFCIENLAIHIGGSIMNKNEILERSRKERNTDEYETKVNHDALGKSVWVLAGICIH